MKKWLIVTTCMAILSGCSTLNNEFEKAFTTPTFSGKDLLGKRWLYEASYGTWSANTEEYYEFSANGKAKSYGTISFQQEGYSFDYKFESYVNWYLDSWYIVEQLTTAKVEPNFSPKLKAAMKANPKLELYGDVLLKFINDKMINVALNEPARRRIEELTPNQWTTKAASSYVICVR